VLASFTWQQASAVNMGAKMTKLLVVAN